MATLYELTQEQMYLYNLLATGEAVDPETGEIDEVVAEQLQLTGEELENKIKGVAIVYKQLSADAKMLKEEEDNLVARRKRAERNAETLKRRLEEVMLLIGKTQYKDSKVDISFRKSTKVEITNEQLLPSNYITEKITYAPNKTLLTSDLKAGLVIEGATLVECQNIQIK